MQGRIGWSGSGCLTLSVLLAWATGLSLSLAQVPGMINYQGRVVVNGTNFDGAGQFQFALVDATGTVLPWNPRKWNSMLPMQRRM